MTFGANRKKNCLKEIETKGSYGNKLREKECKKINGSKINIGNSIILIYTSSTSRCIMGKYYP